MEFRNLTPFHAMAFNAVDVQKNEFHVVALKVGYALERVHSAKPGSDTHRCVLLEADSVIPLATTDEYEGEIGKSSVKWESDLAPFKPKCDVLVRARAYAPNGVPVPSWPARLRVLDSGEIVVDKGLRVTGPRMFRKGWRGWRIDNPETASEVPVRWEHAYGGASMVVPLPGAASDNGTRDLNEVCFTNPLGVGWIEKRYFERAVHGEVVACAAMSDTPARQAKLIELRAPQIEGWDSPIDAPDVIEHHGAGLDARKMAEVASTYTHVPVGLGAIGRAWTPRLQRAGTYDESWLKTRWPYLPEDFDFRYWNAAPDDQQIAWPKPGLAFELANLAPPEETRAGFLRARLPQHRALVALRFAGGAIAPLAMNVDTVLIDTDDMRVLVTWRAVFPLQPAVRICEARFEVDPRAPLLRMESQPQLTETEDAWQTT